MELKRYDVGWKTLYNEWGSEGRRFKSSRPDHENHGVSELSL